MSVKNARPGVAILFPVWQTDQVSRFEFHKWLEAGLSEVKRECAWDHLISNEFVSGFDQQNRDNGFVKNQQKYEEEHKMLTVRERDQSATRQYTDLQIFS